MTSYARDLCFILAFVFVATAGLVGLGIELIGG